MRRKPVDTWKLKKKFTIVAPKIFENKEVGYTFADDPKKLVGRTVDVTLAELTGDYTKMPYIFRLEIVDASEDRATTRVKGMYTERAYLSRFVRRRSSKIEHVFDVVTKDGETLHVKVFVYSLHKLTRAQRTAIRKVVEEVVRTHAQNSDKDIFLQMCAFGNIPREISEKARKVAPIRRVEVAKAFTR